MLGIQLIQDLAVILLAAWAAGWVCQRFGLSPVVGYLLAGIAIGPHTPPFSFIMDEERVQILAQIGMVCLMFSIGLAFSLRRLKQMGLPLVCATALAAFLVFHIARQLGLAFGLDDTAAWFFGGLVVVSSSAVIGKVLRETGQDHQPAGQYALGVTLLEDIVAVVVLTILSPLTRLQEGASVETGGGEPELGVLLGMLAGFILLALVVGLFLVPRLMDLFNRSGTPELRTLLVGGLAFGMATIAVQAGTSLALGAFLIGAIIGETREHQAIERSFSGFRDIFATVFFVSVGMTVDVGALRGSLGWIALLVVFTLTIRPLCVAAALVAVGVRGRTALQAGLGVTPLGEFSFVIASLGVLGGVVPASFNGMAVGAALVSALTAPILIGKGDRIVNRLAARPVPGLTPLITLYQRMLAEVASRGEGSFIWRFLRKRIIQIALEAGLVAAVLLFAQPAETGLRDLLGDDLARLTLGVYHTLFWTVVSLFVLVPLIALWRNLSAVALFLSEAACPPGTPWHRLQAAARGVLQTVFAGGLALWVLVFLPLGEIEGWLLLIPVIVALIVGLVAWRRLIFWHSEVRVALDSAFGDADDTLEGLGIRDRIGLSPVWGLKLGTVELPDPTPLAGHSLRELDLRNRFGVSLVTIDRQGILMRQPGADSHLFPNDRLLILGPVDNIREAERFFRDGKPFAGPGGMPESPASLEELEVETLQLPAGHPWIGRQLAGLDLTRTTGVQILGVRRQDKQIRPLPVDFRFEAGDTALLLGTLKGIDEVRRAVAGTGAD
ncbi:MAG: cation:proton antiporter [Opitutales bacterium]